MGKRSATDANLLELLRRLKSEMRTGPAERAGFVHGQNEFHVGGRVAATLFESLPEAILARFPVLHDEHGAKEAVSVVFDFVAKSDPDDLTIDKVEAALRALPATEWVVHRVLHGAILQQKKTLRLGPFTIWPWPEEANRIETHPAYRNREEFIQSFPSAKNDCVFVSASVGKCRSSTWARESSEERFAQLEEILRFMMGRRFPYDMGIINFTFPYAEDVLTLNDTQFVDGRSFRGTSKPFPIDHPLFLCPSRGHDRIWALISSKQTTGMQARILNAIGWMGRGLHDSNRIRSFVQYMFAYEALLNNDASAGLKYPPSLNHGMAELGAFILGTDKDRRLEVFDRLKRLYRVRCAVAHGGSATVPVAMWLQAGRTVSALITRLLTDPSLCTLQTIDKLYEWAAEQRFSG